VRAVDALNGAAALAALAAATLLVHAVARPPARGAGGDADVAEPGVGSSATVRDAGGVAVPVGDYRRIASASLVADAVLPDLVHVERVVTVTESHRDHHPAAFRTAHAAVLPHRAELETILAHRPDLILVSNTTGDPARVQRARELGYTVFDLGAMEGRRTLLPNIRRLAALLGVPARGEALAARLGERLDRLPLRIRPDQRLPAIYAAAYGSQIYGGTVGSSYHDVLLAAGLVDVAAGEFPGDGWPPLRIEDLIRLGPRILVTGDGGAARLRALPGIGRVDARIVEVDGDLLGDPSLMLSAAEALQRAVYGPPGEDAEGGE